MSRTYLVRLKLKAAQREQAEAMRRETGRAWSDMGTFHWRVYRKKGLWPFKKALRCWAKGRYALHPQSVQALADKLHANFETARRLRRGGNRAVHFPYKRKNFQVVVWTNQSIRVRGRWAVFSDSEHGTSSTCPRCGRRVHPNGRVFRCGCGFVGHRDVVGAAGILGLVEHG